MPELLQSTKTTMRPIGKIALLGTFGVLIVLIWYCWPAFEGSKSTLVVSKGPTIYQERGIVSKKIGNPLIAPTVNQIETGMAKLPEGFDFFDTSGNIKDSLFDLLGLNLDQRQVVEKALDSLRKEMKTLERNIVTIDQVNKETTILKISFDEKSNRAAKDIQNNFANILTHALSDQQQSGIMKAFSDRFQLEFLGFGDNKKEVWVTLPNEGPKFKVETKVFISNPRGRLPYQFSYTYSGTELPEDVKHIVKIE